MSKRKLLALVEQNLVVRVGRSADADDRGPSPARLHAGSHPRLLRPHRRRQEGERRRRRAARAHGPRGPQPAGAARARGPPSAQGRDRELSRRSGRIRSRRSTTRRMPAAGTRKIPFSRVLYIEADDFMEDPPKKFFRLSPGNEVRLRYAYILKCERVIKDAAGVIVELRVHHRSRVAEGRHGGAPRQGNDSLGVSGARHRRRSAALRSPVRVRRSWRRWPRPADGSQLRTHSSVLTGCKVEPTLAQRVRRLEISVRAAGLLLRGSRFAIRARRCSIGR